MLTTVPVVELDTLLDLCSFWHQVLHTVQKDSRILYKNYDENI
jgi:hypothetical protein